MPSRRFAGFGSAWPRSAPSSRRGRLPVRAVRALPRRQWRRLRKRVGLVEMGILVRRDPGQRVERQPIADRRIAGNQEQVLGAQEPGAARPVRARVGFVDPLQRQHVPDDPAEPLLEDPREPRALLFVLQLGLQRVDVHRQPPFPPEIVPDVFVRGDGMLRADPQQVGELHDEALRLRLAVPVVDRLVGDERVVFPDRHAVAPPPAAERPARQRFAGIPLALSEMQQAAGRELLLQALDQGPGQPALPGTESGEVPFGAVHVVDGHERRLAAHREPHVAGRRAPGRRRGRTRRWPAIARRCTAW